MERNWKLLTGSRLLASGAYAAPPPLPNLELAQLTNASAPWSTATNLGGRTCRVLPASATATVELPAWWTGLRPPTGSAWRAEIVFQDNATAPLRVSAFAALPGNVELHRIGGSGDGAWHTALVPLPWDMLARVPGTDRTELSFAALGDAAVPVASVRITEGNPDEDEARWGAETRAWTARVQAEKRQTAKLPPAQANELARTFSTPLVAFVRPWNDLIQCTSAPQAGEVGVPLRVRMAYNEIEPAQFGVYAVHEPLSQVRVALAPEGLVNAKGVQLAADVELFTAEYAVLSDNTIHPARLWPTYPVDIPAQRAHLFWLNIETHAQTAQAGTYRGAIRIQSAGTTPVSLALEVTVLPICLPTMQEAGLTMGGCMSGMPPAHEMAFLARHNHNAMSFFTYGLGIDRMHRGADGRLVLDFDLLDPFMLQARRAGMERFVYFLGGDPYGFPDTLHLERELYRKIFCGNTNGMLDRLALLRKTAADPDHVPPEVKPLYLEWVRQFMAHAQAQNWPEPLLTPFDESPKWNEKASNTEIYYFTNRQNGAETVARPYVRDLEKWQASQRAAGNTPVRICSGGAGPWLKPHFKESCALIHAAWPTARIYASIHHAADGLVFLDDVDVFCSNAISMDPQLGDKVRAGRKIFWQYSWGGDISTPDDARYIFGFYFAAFDSRGSLCWAYNCGSRFDTSSGEQAIYGWTTPYSMVRGLCFEGMREAWDDRRYLAAARTMAKAGHREAELGKLLDGIFRQTAPNRTPGDYASLAEFNRRVNNPHALADMREQLVGFLQTAEAPRSEK